MNVEANRTGSVILLKYAPCHAPTHDPPMLASHHIPNTTPPPNRGTFEPHDTAAIGLIFALKSLGK